MFSGARRVPSSRSTSATRSPGKIPVAGLPSRGHVRIQGGPRRRCCRGRDLPASPSMSVTRRAGSASSYAGSQERRGGSECGGHVVQGQSPSEAVTTQPVCASGPAGQVTHSGSSPMCCTRSATRSRTAPDRPSGWDPGQGEESVRRPTVYSIVLEVPDSRILLTRAAVTRRIGVWAAGNARHRCRRMALDQPRWSCR